MRVAVDTPLDHLLPDCDLVVSHGGAGTVLTSLRHGLPLLLVPQLPDHAGHAGRVVAAGAGEVLTRDEASGSRVAAEVRRLLADGPERAAARALRQEMLAQPAPAAVATQLEALVRQQGAARSTGPVG
ncbi:glycosyltransferase [Streptacidiphilus sp. PB12-B1b]|uniref:glycosyltransferase n=1 Tax=Streptacidiphilus sp. PB12-B1b TaxID=2705012 RepID=UPI001CDC70EA|nr:nucleotide disphospho-sugar-binding domain-containing protein [Streptacidiphilus sp. PB12-B1b]